MSHRSHEAPLMRTVVALGIAVALVALATTSPVRSDAATGSGFPFSNQVVSTPVEGGGYPVPAGSRVPLAGTCELGPYNANHSESWIAVKPGTEDLVGSSKFFFAHLMTTWSRATSASRPRPRPKRCHRAGPTRPIPTSTSTRRGASTKRYCRSTLSGMRHRCIRMAPST